MARKGYKKPKFDVRMMAVRLVATTLLKAFNLNPRDHGKAHIAAIARSIDAFGMNMPILCDENYVIIAGHAIHQACLSVGMIEVPVLVLEHLTETEKIAFRIAHNRLCEKGKWDADLLTKNFDLIMEQDLSFDLELSGFDTGEIDVARMGGKSAIKAAAATAASESEVVELPDVAASPISRIGDRFTIADQTVVCGDARDEDAYLSCLGNELVDAALSDAPYGCPIAGFVSGSGKIKHPDFIMNSGELSREEFRAINEEVFRRQAACSKPGAVHFNFCDWRSVVDMSLAAEQIFAEHLHTLVWHKTAGGMGSRWRGAYELILAHRVPGGKARNNVMLGTHGRNRTDVLEYAGVNTFRAGRMEDLEAHPTCKPIPLLAGLILDVTPIGGLVLDSYLGSGSTLLAAHETKRRGIGIELDPKYVDVAIMRLQKATRQGAIHHSGKTFAQLEIERRKSA